MTRLKIIVADVGDQVLPEYFAITNSVSGKRICVKKIGNRFFQKVSDLQDLHIHQILFPKYGGDRT